MESLGPAAILSNVFPTHFTNELLKESTIPRINVQKYMQDFTKKL